MKEFIQLEFDFDFKPKKFLDDPNRELMIKYKYDRITEKELDQLHLQLQNLIYDSIRKNYIKMDIKDVYQEIWKKIAKAKHSWNENNGTRVSTWIVCVCMSVINGLRMNLKKHNDRYCLYNDLSFNQEDEDVEGENLAIKYSLINDVPLKEFLQSESMKRFIDSLNDTEKDIIDIVLNSTIDDFNESSSLKYKKKKITKIFIKEKSGLNQKEFKDVMDKLKFKFKKLILDEEK